MYIDKAGLYDHGEMFYFNEKTRRIGGDNQHKVVIQQLPTTTKGENGAEPTIVAGPYVVGYLQGDFDYNVTAEYETMFDSIIGTVPGAGLIKKASILKGKPLGASGIFKRKFYTGGGYVTFNVDFRIFSDAHYKPEAITNDKKILSPKYAAHWLASLCLPTDPYTVTQIFENIKTAVGNSPINADSTTSEIVGAGFKILGEELKDMSDSPIPKTVRVKIGSMFDSSDMIVESVNIKYSKENVLAGNDEEDMKDTDEDKNSKSPLQKKYQPLYVDISMSVSTATVPQDGKTGLLENIPSVTYGSEVMDIVGQLQPDAVASRQLSEGPVDPTTPATASDEETPAAAPAGDIPNPVDGNPVT